MKFVGETYKKGPQETLIVIRGSGRNGQEFELKVHYFHNIIPSRPGSRFQICLSKALNVKIKITINDIRFLNRNR